MKLLSPDEILTIKRGEIDFRTSCEPPVDNGSQRTTQRGVEPSCLPSIFKAARSHLPKIHLLVRAPSFFVPPQKPRFRVPTLQSSSVQILTRIVKTVLRARNDSPLVSQPFLFTPTETSPSSKRACLNYFPLAHERTFQNAYAAHGWVKQERPQIPSRLWSTSSALRHAPILLEQMSSPVASLAPAYLYSAHLDSPSRNPFKYFTR